MEFPSLLPTFPLLALIFQGRAALEGKFACITNIPFSAHAKLGKGGADEFITVSDGEVAKRGCVFSPTPLAEMTWFQGCHQSLYPTVNM